MNDSVVSGAQKGACPSYKENTQINTHETDVSHVYYCFCTFAHDGSGGTERKKHHVGNVCRLDGRARRHRIFYLGGIAFLCWSVCVKNTRSTFGTRRGRAFIFIHFARFLFLSLLSFSLCFPFSFFALCVVIFPFCFVFLLPFLFTCFLPSLFLVFLSLLLISNIYIIIIIYTYFVGVCAYVHTRTHARETRRK